MERERENMRLVGEFKGHAGWVTAISAPLDNSDFIISSSRDKSILVWEVKKDTEGKLHASMKKILKGHSHFVQDVVLSSDGQYCLSASWDSTLRLWDLKTGTTSVRFDGHQKDVLSVAFSADNRYIVSGSRDRTARLWNTLGEQKVVIGENGHSDWVSCVRFSPAAAAPVLITAGWDKLVKVWTLGTYGSSFSCKLVTTLAGHNGFISTVTVSPDGSLCASGGKDGTAMLWDLNKKEHLYSLDAKDVINALCFSPNRYWLCAATNNSVKIWDLETKEVKFELTELSEEDAENPEPTETKRKFRPACTCLSWSSDGHYLYAGFTDGVVRAWQVY